MPLPSGPGYGRGFFYNPTRKMMSMFVRLHYGALQVGVNTTVPIPNSSIGGFLPATSGSVTVTGTNDAGNVITIVPVTPCVAGEWVFMPYFIGAKGGAITTSGGASGVLAS